MQTTRGPNVEYTQISSELALAEPQLKSLRAKANVLRQQIAETSHEVKAFSDRDIAVKTLQREAEICDINYRKFANDVEDARIDHLLQVERLSNISVVQPATLDRRPVFPNIPLNLLIGLMLGSFFSCAWALSAESYSRVPHSK